jgi:hypothetical protein
MSPVLIKRGDTKGKFIDLLKLDGVTVNLTGCTGKFLMRRRGRDKANQTITQTATLFEPPVANPDASLRNAEYQPILADVDTEGEYDQEWQITFPSGQILTFPNNRFNTVQILRDLGD